MVKVLEAFYSLINRSVPFHDFGFISRECEEEIIERVRLILRMQHIGQLNKVVSEFEKYFKSVVGAPYAIGLGSGTAALFFALKTLGIGHGKEVITVANTFVSTITSVNETGAKCRFVDIDKSTGLMDTTKLERFISPSTVAIIPVHMYGSMVKMDKVMELARMYGLSVIEDACQAIGSSYLGRHAGTWGDIGCFSFHITKIVGGQGDGGMLITRRKDVYNNIKRIALPDWKTALDLQQERIPSRLAPIFVSILEGKLKRINESVRLRTRQFMRYQNGLKDNLKVRLLKLHEGVISSYRNCILVSEAREKILEIFNRYRIPSEIIYPKSEILLNQIESKGTLLPQTRYLVRNHLSLPIGANVSDDLIDMIIDLIRRCNVK